MFFLPFLCILFIYPKILCAQEYNVKDFGAIGDGKTDDTMAIRKAFSAAKNSNGGRVIFDSGYNFLTGCFNVSSNVIIDVRGTILAWNDTDHYIMYAGQTQALVYSYLTTNITLTGGGLIDGRGNMGWWKCALNETLPPCNKLPRPHLIEFQRTDQVLIYNLTMKDSMEHNVYLANASNVHIHDITILAPSSKDPVNPSRNTDGINVVGTTGVLIENCFISNGDDAIAVSGGSNYGHPTGNVLARNLTIGTSHGLSIGSLTSNGVVNVTFTNITMNGSEWGIHIKSDIGHGGFVENITYSNINLYNISLQCIILDMNYTQDHPSTGHGNDTRIPVRGRLEEN